jgi:hypothetical protein
VDKIRFKKRPTKRPNFNLPPMFHFYVYVNNVKNGVLYIEQRTDEDGSYFSVMRRYGRRKNGLPSLIEVVRTGGYDRLGIFERLIDAKRELLKQLYGQNPV